MLTSQQIADRAGKLTASRVACLMTGDKNRIQFLYRETFLTTHGADEWIQFLSRFPEWADIGEPEDLSVVWPVRLGEATEEINLEWYERKTGICLTRKGAVWEHPKQSWAGATLDGWDPRLQCPVEAKHCGGRETMETIIDRYQPQMQWQMYVTGAKQCALSVIMGANAPIVEYIDRDEDYIKEMVTRASAFMLCVKTKTPPVALDPVPAPAAPGTKVYDMTGNNEWGNYAHIWLDTKMVRDNNEVSARELKSMVPADAKKAHGHGVQITRDRAGRLSLRESAE